MAQKAIKSETVAAQSSDDVERTYTFPDLGVSVKAKGLDAATKAAKKKAKEK